MFIKFKNGIFRAGLEFVFYQVEKVVSIITKEIGSLKTDGLWKIYLTEIVFYA